MMYVLSDEETQRYEFKMKEYLAGLPEHVFQSVEEIVCFLNSIPSFDVRLEFYDAIRYSITKEVKWGEK